MKVYPGEGKEIQENCSEVEDLVQRHLNSAKKDLKDNMHLQKIKGHSLLVILLCK